MHLVGRARGVSAPGRLLPRDLNAAARGRRHRLDKKAIVYDLLSKTALETMMTIAADPKHLVARIRITTVLHT